MIAVLLLPIFFPSPLFMLKKETSSGLVLINQTEKKSYYVLKYKCALEMRQ